MNQQLEEVIKKNLPEKKEPTEHQISCPDHMPGCCVYHCEYRLSNEDKSFNQALSQINTSLITDEVLKAVVEKIEMLYGDIVTTKKDIAIPHNCIEYETALDDVVNLLSNLSPNKENENNG